MMLLRLFQLALLKRVSVEDVVLFKLHTFRVSLYQKFLIEAVNA